MLVAECTGGRVTTSEDAALLRRNLLAHDLVPDAPYVLLAFPSHFFLWLPKAQADQLPNFAVSAEPVLREYLGERTEKLGELCSGSLQLLLVCWLDDLACAMRQPDPKSEADQMMVDSGLYDQIRRGEVKSEEIE